MDISKYKKKTKELVIKPMLELIKEWGAEDYTRRDVRKCKKLIYAYLKNISSLVNPTNDDIMEQVKTLVLALNDLNKSTDYSIIETEERETIWEIIQTSAVECGLKDAPDDITEEWRDW